MRLCALLVAIPFALVAPAASAQDDDGAIPARGLFSVRFAHAYEMTDLDVGPGLDDSRGLDVAAGFSLGDYTAFQLGYEWQTEDDFDTHYFPLIFRGYSPRLLERARLYGEAGIGLFFSLHHGSLAANTDRRAAGFHAGGGLQVDITDEVGLLWYAKYKGGIGEADDWESVVHGVGLQYSWGL